MSQRQGLGTIWYNWKHIWEYCIWTVLTVIERTEKLAAETPLPGNAQVWITKETRGGEYFMVMNQPSARKEPDIWPIIIFQTLDHIPDIWPIIIPDTWPYSIQSSNHPIIMILADSKINSDDQSKSVAAVRSGTEHGINGKKLVKSGHAKAAARFWHLTNMRTTPDGWEIHQAQSFKRQNME